MFNIAPSGPPLDIQLIPESISSIIISWGPPLPEQQNGRIIRYYVIITDTGFTLNRNLTFNISDGLTQLIDRLNPDTTYAIRVAAATIAGIGPYSTIMSVTTPRNGEHLVIYVN